MKLQEIMTRTVIHIHPEENVAVAARTLARYNIGALPVCDGEKMLGMVTDRDLVTRCVAAGRLPEKTRVREVMTAAVVSADPDMNTAAAARLMGRRQVRRLPVVAEGKVLGMVSLSDLAAFDSCSPDAAEALEEICANVSER